MTKPVVPDFPAAPLWWRLFFMAWFCAAFLFHSAAMATPADNGRKQILFVEDNIADYRQLVAADMDVVVLDGRQDGLRQIAQALETRRGIDALHLISHGGPAVLQLGALQLDQRQLAARAADLGTIRAALRADADILLYGCNVAQGEPGQRFIGQLAAATGASVAASNNLTGAASEGGDWLLESRTAPLHGSALAFPAYRQVLPTVAGSVAIPFNHPDNQISTSILTDGQANSSTTDIPGIVYQFYFADTGNTPTGLVTNIDLGGGTGSMLLYIKNGSYDPVGALVVKSQSNKLFGLSTFRIQDVQALSSTYTATGYRNNVNVTGGWNFTTAGNLNPLTITLPAQFKNIDELRITSNGGISGQGAKLWQEGFNNFVFVDPTINADLAALSASAASLSPNFSSATTSYSFAVPWATTSTTVTPTVDTPGSTVTVNGTPVSSGAASGTIPLNVGSNTITIVVTALDGSTTKTYTITATRAAPPSSNANLSNLVLSQGTLTPGFAAATTSYTASVPFSTTSLTVTPTKADANASITVNGVAVTSGNASGAIALAVGANTVTTVVTAQDGSTKTYTTTVTRAAASGNNQLSALALSSGTLTPGFAPGTTSYTASVGNATTSLTVTPTVADASATVTVNGVATTSGNASGAIPLNVGSNTVTVTVTAQNGTPLSYTVNVTRAGSANADLSALSLSSGTLSPNFAPATTDYTASVANAITSITVTPTVLDATASVTVNGVAVASGNASAAIPLNVGSNIITTVVTAQDGTTTKTYTVTVTRAASSNNNLSALGLSSGALSPGFNSATTSYTASIAAGTASISVTPTAAVGTASITVNGVAVASGAPSAAIAMNPGSNTVTVVVTAQNGATKSYTVTVTRTLPSINADLSALSLSNGSLTPPFATGTTSYSASVGNATTSLTVTPTVADATASVTVNGVAVASGNASGPIALAVGANTVNVAVTAQDGTTVKTYTVTVTRAASSDANLAALALSGGSLTPAFAPGTTSYTMAIAAATGSITVTPAVNEPNATVTVNGVAVASGNTSAPIAMNTGANTVTVVVTAQNGGTKTYAVTVTRAASANNDLGGLSLSSGTLNPVFSAGQLAYSASVPNASSTITVTPTVADASASVTVNGVSVASGAASGPIPLNVGANVITVVVTAQDGAPRTYTITVSRNVSSNADLSALTLSSGTLTPVFASATTSYTAIVPNATTSLTLTPSAASGSTITVNGVASANGAPSAPVALNLGANVITVVVTAQDGVTTNTYTVSVTRAAAALAELTGLSLSNGVLAPAFSAATTNYSASVDNGTASVSVTPLTGTGSITVNGVPTASGNPSAPVALAVGSNVISVVVTAPNGINSKTYTITVTRAAAANADLAALSVPGATLAPAFAPGVSSYALALPAGTTSISVIPTVADPNSRVTVNGVAVASGSASAAIALAPGNNSVLVSVTAQNGAVKTYTITATRAVSDNAALGGLAASAGSLNPAFTSATTAYALAVPNASASISLTPTLADPAASVTVNGVAVASGSASAPLALAVGSNTITIVVTAPSGKAVTTTVTVTRAPPPSASLAGLVYTDSNNDGINDSGESGLAGVTIKLDGIDVDGAKVELSTVTGSDGRFAFDKLKGGTYTLTEVQPGARADGKETAGNLGGTVDNSGFDASAARNQIANIVLAPGAVGSGYLFGEQNSGTLQGFVYVDANNNGVKDSGEAGLSGVRVTLSGSAAGTATSGADGSFSFPGLTAGNYTLRRNSTDIDGAQYADGQERAGVAGGTVNNANFGTQAFQASISNIGIDGALLASSGGKLDGYLFGLRPRAVPGLKLPIVSGTITLGDKPMPGTPGALVAGWNVNLSQNGQSLCTVQSNAQGQYQLDNLVCAGYAQSGLPTGSGFALEFSKPGSNLSGTAESGGGAGSSGNKTIRNLSLSASDEITQQNLALKPTGIVYDALSRLPLAGVTVSVSGPPGFDAATHLAGGQNQVTGSDGAYQVQLQNGYPSGTYTLAIAKSPSGYGSGSRLLPACAGTLSVGAAPDPALVQASASAPGANVPRHDAAACAGLVAGGASSTQYYLKLQITNGVSAPLMNNHIPLDAALAAGLALSKTGDRQTAELGDTVRYTIVLTQGAASTIAQASVRDVLPAGFRYVPGSATVNGARAADPALGAGSVLGFRLGGAAAGQQLVLSYRARIGVGSMQGDGINRAWAYACASADGCLDPATLAPRAAAIASNEARFQVKVTGGVFTNEACVAGKVFADCNRNGVQDAGEAGIPGVRLYLEDGTSVRTDNDGKYSYCGLAPSAHVIKVDPVSLPAGSVMGETSNRNLGDPDSLLLDVRNGELIRADFAETSCAAPVQERIRLGRARQDGQAREEPAPPPASSPGITFSSKEKRKVNSKPVQGEQHAH